VAHYLQEDGHRTLVVLVGNVRTLEDRQGNLKMEEIHTQVDRNVMEKEQGMVDKVLVENSVEYDKD